MAIKELILKEKVQGLGDEGDIVSPKAGFAQNYLLSQKKAIEVNRENLRYIEVLKKKAEERKTRELFLAQETAKRIEDLFLEFSLKISNLGKAFGSISTTEIFKELEKREIVVPKKSILLSDPIKKTGENSIEISLHPEVIAKLKFIVIAEKSSSKKTSDASEAEQF